MLVNLQLHLPWSIPKKRSLDTILQKAIKTLKVDLSNKKVKENRCRTRELETEERQAVSILKPAKNQICLSLLPKAKAKLSTKEIQVQHRKSKAAEDLGHKRGKVKLVLMKWAILTRT